VILIVLKAKIRPEKRDEWLAGIKQYTADGADRSPATSSFDYYENGQDPNEFRDHRDVSRTVPPARPHVATEHASAFFALMPAMITTEGR